MSHFIILGIMAMIFAMTVGHAERVNIASGNSTTAKPKRVALGGVCSHHYDCVASFSHCAKGICRCQSNFKPTGPYSCTPTVYSCPGGKEIGANPVLCHVYSNPLTGGSLPTGVSRADANRSQRHNGLIDSCPEGFFCALHERNNTGSGHCCPAETPWCPAGKPDLSRTCEYSWLRMDDPIVKPDCPTDSHFCHELKLNGRVYAAFCCPQSCSFGEFGRIWMNNTCIPISKLGGKCELNDQCQRYHSECRNGTCQCQNRYHKDFDGLESCERGECPSESETVLEPLKTAIGNPVSCNSDRSSCPGNYYCLDTKHICCPIPEDRCPSSISNSTQPLQQVNVVCDTYGLREENNCPPGQYCHRPVETVLRAAINREILGICCSRDQS